jgi:hypothetical protein
VLSPKLNAGLRGVEPGDVGKLLTIVEVHPKPTRSWIIKNAIAAITGRRLPTNTSKSLLTLHVTIATATHPLLEGED